MRRWAIALLMIVPLLLVPWSGCGGGGNGDPAPTPPDNGDPTPPEVTEASVEPTEIRFSGGDVTISATVDSEEPINKVEADVEGPEETQTVELQADGNGYSAIFAAPPNGQNEAVVYRVTVTATSNADQTSAPFDAGEFSVLTAGELPMPEDPPGNWAELSVPARSDFTGITMGGSGSIYVADPGGDRLVVRGFQGTPQ